MKQSTLPSRKHAKKRPVPPKVLRADIQGLRAFAVIVVVLDHLAGWPVGGFVGVDIFLVISGFLITGHLMREWERTGTISFVGFYKRRIKRILPAATTAIVFTVVVSFLLFTGNRAWSIFWDGLAATFFAGNWRFAAAETDYFQAGGPISPLQHFWSLGVEEQFYFAWPWLMLVALTAMSRFRALRPHPRITAGTVILALTAGSFAWAMHETATSPTVAYFSTFSRAWELGVGALLALVAPACGRIDNNWRPVLAWTAAIGMVASLFVISPDSAFPGPWAALPVASSALFIMAGTGGTQRFLGLFTNPVSGYIGDISYSLYLWHFPVIIFLSALIPQPTASYYALAVFVMLFLAASSFHLVEDPIRSSNWLVSSKTAPSLQWNYRDRWLAFMGAFTVCAVSLTFMSQPAPLPAQASASYTWNAEKIQADEPKYGPELTQIQDDIKSAVSADKWPDLRPDEDTVSIENWMRQIRETTCLDVQADNISDCYFPAPEGDKTAVLVGDSHAIAWSPGVREALLESGYNLQMLTMQQCAAADAVFVKNDGSAYPECTQHNEWAQEEIERIKPDLVFLASSSGAVGRLASEAKGSAGVKEYTEGLGKTIRQADKNSGRVVVLSTPPAGAQIEECKTRSSRPFDCQSNISVDWKNFVDGEKQVATKNDAFYADTRLWFCNRNELCPIFAGDTLVRVDAGHLTVEYSTSLAPVIKSEVLKKM